MLKKTIPYTDFNGNKKEKDVWFNLSQAELIELELSTKGGLAETMQKIIDAQNGTEIVKIFKDIILKSYGEISEDGETFMKEDENGHPLANKFKHTAMFSALFTELSTDADAAAEFMNGVIPADLAKKVAKEQAKQKVKLKAADTKNE